MNKTVKTTLLILNLAVFIFAVLWINTDSGYEPKIVALMQFAAILAIIFEKRISNYSIKKVSDSDVDIDIEGDDLDISVEDIKDGSNINVKKR